MKKRIAFLLPLIASLLTLIASVSASSACAFIFYQPYVPKSLRK